MRSAREAADVARHFGAQLHEIKHVVQRRLLGVDQVHRDLRLTIDFQTQSFDVAEPARGAADRLGDVLGDLKIRRWAEVDVVGDEKWSRTDRDRAEGRVNPRRPEVGIPRRILAQLIAQSLEFSATNVGEVRKVFFVHHDPTKHPGWPIAIDANGDSAGLHHPAYNFDDDAIVFGTSYWIKLVENTLAA